MAFLFKEQCASQENDGPPSGGLGALNINWSEARRLGFHFQQAYTPVSNLIRTVVRYSNCHWRYICTWLAQLLRLEDAISVFWRRSLQLSLLLVAVLFGIRDVTGDAVKAVAFTFSDLDGHPVRLADYHGKWVLVSFWATWCPLCKIQIPSLNTFNQRPDFRVIGVALDYTNEEAVREAIAANGLHYDAQVAGGSRHNPNGVFRQIGPVDFFPTSYLYDPTGEIVMFIPGQLQTSRVLSFMQNWYAQRGGTRTFAARPERLAAFLRKQYGEHGGQAYAEWKHLLDANVNATPVQRLTRVNDFFNQRVQPGDGRQIWGRSDYWATPGEVLGSRRGSSEDIAIAKYFTLLALNIAPEQLRLIYVKAHDEPHVGPVHLVLAWYGANERDPLLLDSGAVAPASKKSSLQPVFSFNSLSVRNETASAADDMARLATWEDTLRRARDEGFE